MDSLYDEFPLPDDKTHMRVVKLSPRQADSQIALDLQVVALSGVPYVALSYCWGPPTDLQEIILGGRSWEIRRNLWDFLSEMTRSGLLGDRPIFVDAVCIDQENLVERSSQVSIMQKIYKGAEEVLTWIGKSDPESTRFLSTLRYVEDARLAYWRARGQNVQKPVFETDDEYTQDDGQRRVCLGEAINTVYDDEGGYVQRLKDEDSVFARDYWQRVWTIQECLLSRNVTLVCGDKHVAMETLGSYINDRPISNDALFIGPEDVFRATAQSEPGGTILLPRIYMSNLPNWAASFDWGSDPFGRFGLFKWLTLFGDRKCTDERDKVYGMLGIATDFDPKAKSIRRDGASFAVDYTKDSMWLFFRVLGAFTEQHPVQFALLLRKRLGIEQYISVCPPAESLLRSLDMSAEEMNSSVFRLELINQAKLDAELTKPDNAAISEGGTAMRVSTMSLRDPPATNPQAFVFTFADAHKDDDLVAVRNTQVTAALIMRSRVTEEPVVELEDTRFDSTVRQKRTVVRPGLLERECIGIAVVKTPRMELEQPGQIWRLLPENVNQHLTELSKLPIGSLVGRRDVVPIERVDDLGNFITGLEYTCSWLEMFCLTSEHWFDVRG